MKPKNVLLVTIDALPYASLGYAGRAPSPSPTLDRLMGEGTVFSQMISTACPTQFVMPAVHTSTLPLDHGGYEFGIRGRGATLAESFAAAGYQTAWHNSAGFLTQLYGYDRGFETFSSLLSPVVVARDTLWVVARFYESQFKAGKVSLEHCTRFFESFLPGFFDLLLRLCAERAGEIEGGDVPLSGLLHNWDFERLATLVELERAWFRRDPRRYTHDLLTHGYSHVVHRLYSVPKHHTAPQPWEFMQEAYAELGASAGPHQSSVSGAYVVDRFLGWLDAERRPAAPFFSCLHLLDVHEVNIFSHDRHEAGDPVLAGELEQARELIARLDAAGANADGRAIHACGLAYLDRQVARLLRALDERGLRDDTLLVLYADHGWASRAPAHRKWEPVALFEENLHVPLVLHGPGIPARRDDGLASMLDLPATLLDLAGIPAPASFRGESLLGRRAPRPYVQVENLGRGPCDFSLKPMHIGVRSATHKLVCEVMNGPGGLAGGVTHLYDLAADPLESRNLADRPIPAELQWMAGVAQQRALEVVAGLRPAVGIAA